jgi:hypothetical protein
MPTVVGCGSRSVVGSRSHLTDFGPVRFAALPCSVLTERQQLVGAPGREATS